MKNMMLLNYLFFKWLVAIDILSGQFNMNYFQISRGKEDDGGEREMLPPSNFVKW